MIHGHSQNAFSAGKRESVKIYGAALCGSATLREIGPFLKSRSSRRAAGFPARKRGVQKYMGTLWQSSGILRIGPGPRNLRERIDRTQARQQDN